MLSVQLGSALSVHLIAHVGAGGMAWMRLTAGAGIFLLIARPPLRTLRWGDAPVLVALGATTGLQTTAFLAAADSGPATELHSALAVFKAGVDAAPRANEDGSGVGAAVRT